MIDYYETLGVEKNATSEQIKKAYRRRAKKAHPDTGGSTEEMTAVNVAFDCLSNPQKRLRYDATGIDDKRAEDEKILNMLQQVMNHAIDKDLTIEQCVQSVANDLVRLGARLMTEKNALEKYKARLGTVRRKKNKAGVDLFEKELRKRIFHQEAMIKNTEEDHRMLGLVRKKLREEYEDSVRRHYDPSGLTWQVQVF